MNTNLTHGMPPAVSRIMEGSCVVLSDDAGIHWLLQPRSVGLGQQCPTGARGLQWCIVHALGQAYRVSNCNTTEVELWGLGFGPW